MTISLWLWLINRQDYELDSNQQKLVEIVRLCIIYILYNVYCIVFNHFMEYFKSSDNCRVVVFIHSAIMNVFDLCVILKDIHFLFNYRFLEFLQFLREDKKNMRLTVEPKETLLFDTSWSCSTQLFLPLENQPLYRNSDCKRDMRT